MTSFFQGSLTLEDKYTETETLLGLRIVTKSNLALHLHSQGFDIFIVLFGL